MTIAPPWVIALAIAPLIGSFMGVLIARLPRGRSIVLGRSECRHCGGPLGISELVPLISWMWLRGRCRACRESIGWRYPAIELAAMLVALWAAREIAPAPLLWASCGYGWILLTLGIIDARHFLLPDALTLPLMALGLAVAGIIEPDRLPDHIIGAIGGFAIFALIARFYRVWRGREGLGGGDTKLLGAIGAWVSWTGLPSVVLLAALLALAVMLALTLAGRRIGPLERIPFGSFLALAGWLVWLYGPIDVVFAR